MAPTVHAPRNRDGLVGRFFRRLIGSNWKTTMSGYTYAIAQAVILAPHQHETVKYWASVVSAIAIGTAMRFAKDEKKDEA